MIANILEVRAAVENDELVPCFQPWVELRTGRLAGFEVLARWKPPEHSLVLPENFIALAEEDGRIGQLMEQILRKACLSGCHLPAPLRLAVNVSPVQLLDLSLPDQIRRAAEQSGFPTNRLTIEITETALANDLGKAQQIARELKGMGCRLALDDFGTGYSSLGHLQALPFDELKINRSFVENMTKTRESRKIVAAIIGLGNSLDLKTIAEGVETEEQADMLLWLGCELGQGWLYGRPTTADTIPDLVAAPPRATPAGVSTYGDGWAVSSLEALPMQRLAQLQAIYDGAPVGLCFLDRNLRYVSINRRLAEMNGASIAAHLGKTVEELIPESFPILEPFLRRALQGESIAEVEVERPGNNSGDASWTALLSYQPALDEADEVIGISVAVSDITAHKQMAAALHESEERHRHMETTRDRAPWIMDAEGNSLQVSSDWVTTSTVHKGRLRNLGWLEALHTDDLEQTMKTMKAALKSGRPIDIEYRVQDVDGNWRWMRSRGSPRFGPSGEVIRWYGSVENIDDQKEAAYENEAIVETSAKN
jgi:PAS domain S-box-containing protein